MVTIPTRFSASIPAVMVCSCVVAVSSFAADTAAPPQAASAQASPPQASPAPAPPPAAKREPRILRPQVSMTGFSREYRPLPLDASQKIIDALEKTSAKGFDFTEASLLDVIHRFVDELGIPIDVDRQALEDEGFDMHEALVTATTAGMSNRSALDRVLRDARLTWTIVDETLTVTSKSRAEYPDNLMIVTYPVPRAFGQGGSTDVQAMIDVIQSAIATTTWDASGGPGSIKPLESGGDALLVVSQTAEVHEQVERFLRLIHERNLAEFASGRPVVRVHRLANVGVADNLVANLVNLCNGALDKAGDPNASVTLIGDSVAVLSKSREFHALAAQTIAAVAGVVEQPPSGFQHDRRYDMGSAPFCWVAREVYGAGDPRWLVFRGWMTDEAPRWLRDAYAAFGPDVAAWLHERPLAKAAIRRLMDVVIEPRMVGLRAGPALP